jgi:hypothetical protein
MLALRFPQSPYSPHTALEPASNGADFAEMAFAYRQGTRMSQAYQRGSIRRPTDCVIDRARSGEGVTKRRQGGDTFAQGNLKNCL